MVDFKNWNNFDFSKELDGFFTKRTEVKFQKFDDAFKKKSGVCYIDNSSKEYTFKDLYEFFYKEEPAEYLFKILQGSSPEKALENDYHFQRCRRCGNWIFSKDQKLFSKDSLLICERCTPVKSKGKIKLWKDPYEDDRKFFPKRAAVFTPGLTTLIGCNGVGKTTLLRNIEENLKEKGIPFLKFDNLGNEGGEKSFGRILSGAAGMEDDDPVYSSTEYAVSLWASSEGEKIRESFLHFVKKVMKQIRLYKGYGEFWLLFDALDSGLSMDVIQDIKECIFGNLLKEVPPEMDLYIILSSNSFEMSEGTSGFSIEKMRYIPVKTFSQFKKAVLSSALYKEDRDKVLLIKAEICERPYQFSFDEETAKDYSGSRINMDRNCAEMILGQFRIVLNLFRKNYNYKKTYRLYRKENDTWKEIPCRDMDTDSFGSIWKDQVEKEMHEYLCRRVFLAEEKK